MRFRHWYGLFIAVALPATVTGQTLMSPAAFLGYELGEQFTPHHKVVSYFQHVESVVSNVTLRQYGETYEGRPLLLATVSSSANMARLDQIRASNLRRTHLVDGDPGADETAIVWLSYNVHGNESVSTEAAMATLYTLADPTNSRSQQWLQNTVVLLDPAINPYGRDRYVSWYNQTVGRWNNASPAAREHREPWPGGRTNHYMFDLNRDWAWTVQQESQHRLAVYQEWMPHVHLDFHEMGVNSPYYFAPAAEPYHEDITNWQREFQRTIGTNHASYFDDQGWLYYTREVFDLLYPSYGDTYPVFNGAVGMTHEQGGGGRAGLGIETAEGDTLTLADRIAHHYTTGLSTVEVTSQHASQVVQEFGTYFDRGLNSPPGEYKTYVIRASNDPDKIADLLAMMDVHQIRYGVAGNARNVDGFSYVTGENASVRIEANDIVISAYQPKSVLVKVLFEPDAVVADSLTYDITAWALPYAHGLDAVATDDRIDPAGPVTMPMVTNAAGGRPYAYLARWGSFTDARFLAAVLRQGVSARFAEKPFTMDGEAYASGTVIITRTGNAALGEDFDRIVVESANAMGQPVIPVATGMVTSGADFGSNSVSFVDAPKVGLVAGQGTSSGSMGQIWHYFERQLEYPVTLIHADAIGNTDFSEFDVLILPSGSYGGIFNEGAVDRLRDWVRFGGRLIALENAVGFLADQDGFDIAEVEDEDEEDEEDGANDERLRAYGDRQRAGASEGVPGAVFKVRLDNTHPLGFGYPNHYFTLKLGDDRYEFLEDGWNVGVIQQPATSGFVGGEIAQDLTDILVFGVQNMGGGAVVYMVDNPFFRGFWQGGKLLIANAVFFVGQ